MKKCPFQQHEKDCGDYCALFMNEDCSLKLTAIFLTNLPTVHIPSVWHSGVNNRSSVTTFSQPISEKCDRAF